MEEEVGRIAAERSGQGDAGAGQDQMLADFYGGLESLISRADSLAIRQLLTGDAASLNRVPRASSPRSPPTMSARPPPPT